MGRLNLMDRFFYNPILYNQHGKSSENFNRPSRSLRNLQKINKIPCTFSCEAFRFTKPFQNGRIFYKFMIFLYGDIAIRVSGVP